jgi:prefoldin subunit 5
MTDYEALDRAMTLMQLQAELIESLQGQIVELRAERDEARTVRALLLEVCQRQDALSQRLIGV